MKTDRRKKKSKLNMYRKNTTKTCFLMPSVPDSNVQGTASTCLQVLNSTVKYS